MVYRYRLFPVPAFPLGHQATVVQGDPGGLFAHGAEQGFGVEIVAPHVGDARDFAQGGRLGLPHDPRLRGLFLRDEVRSADAAVAVDIGIAAGHVPAGILQVFPEIVGAGEGAELVGEVLGLGGTVGGERAAHLGVGGQVRGVQVQAVPRSGPACQGVVLQVHPGRFRIGLLQLDGLAFGRGFDLEVDGVLVEAEGVGTGAVVGAQVVVAPTLVLQIAFIRGSMAHDAAVDGLDAGFAQEGFPQPEQPARIGGDAVPGADGGVSVPDDVNVSHQDSVPDFTGVAQFGGEAVVRAEGVEGGAGGDQFQVGGRHQAQFGVVTAQGAAVPVHGQDPPGGSFQGTALPLLVNIALCRSLCSGKKDRNQPSEPCQEPFSHQISRACS